MSIADGYPQVEAGRGELAEGGEGIGAICIHNQQVSLTYLHLLSAIQM